MIDAVTGTLVAKMPTSVVVQVGGFNLRLLISVSCFETLPALGRDVTLLSYLHVREDAMQLYGFADFSYLHVFGPKSNVNKQYVAPYPRFYVGHLNLYLSSTLGERWRSLAEVRFTYAPLGDDDRQLVLHSVELGVDEPRTKRRHDDRVDQDERERHDHHEREAEPRADAPQRVHRSRKR